jgi:hypothetical protein
MLFTWMQVRPDRRHHLAAHFFPSGRRATFGTPPSVRSDGGFSAFRQMVSFLWDIGTLSPLPVCAVSVLALPAVPVGESSR